MQWMNGRYRHRGMQTMWPSYIFRKCCKIWHSIKLPKRCLKIQQIWHQNEALYGQQISSHMIHFSSWLKLFSKSGKITCVYLSRGFKDLTRCYLNLMKSQCVVGEWNNMFWSLQLYSLSLIGKNFSSTWISESCCCSMLAPGGCSITSAWTASRTF